MRVALILLSGLAAGCDTGRDGEMVHTLFRECMEMAAKGPSGAEEGSLVQSCYNVAVWMSNDLRKKAP